MSITESSFSALNHCKERIADYDQVILHIRRCPTIGSLKSVNDALNTLTAKSQSPVTEIAEVISRDLSLTARLIRLVNSVFGGLTVKITSIEEAIFFLGLRQIRQMAMTTRVIDEVEKMSGGKKELDWKKIWRHSIGSGILTREILSMTNGIIEDDTYYICGLLHDIGKLVMLNVYPEELEHSQTFQERDTTAFSIREKKEFGWNHAELGAMYLEINGLPREIVEAILFHHEPEKAPHQKAYASGIQVADCITRYGGCEAGFENVEPIEYSSWEELEGWEFLFHANHIESQFARASVLNSIERLPSILQGLL